MTLNDIRKKSGLLLIVIGMGMFGFIFMDLMSSGTSLFQREQNLLLQVGDHKVSFVDFERDLEEIINVKYGTSLGSINISQDQRNSERDLLWDQTIKDIVLSKKANQSGIVIGKSEIWDLISGEITQNQAQLFGFFFREQTESGEWISYDPEMIQNWIEIGSDNPQWFRYLHFKHNTVRDRAHLKYTTALKKGLYATMYDAKSYYKDQTQSHSGQYVYIPNSFVSDVKVTEKEIKNYYKKNKIEFQNNPNRVMTYYMFNLKASEADKKTIRNEMEELVNDRVIFNKKTNLEEIDLGFANTDDLEGFVNQYGDNKYQLNTIPKVALNDLQVQKQVILPHINDNIYRMGRIIEDNLDSVVVVYLDREIYASDQTLNQIYSDVYEIINQNKQISHIDELSNQISGKPRTVTLEKMDQSVPGLGLSRNIVRWLFNPETNLHQPKFFDLEDKYIIAVASEILEEEHQSISDVYDDIEFKLKSKKRGQSIINQINEKNFSSLKNIANQFNADVQNIANLKMSSDIFGDEGFNPQIVGSFCGLDSGKISDPIITDNGVFILRKEASSEFNYPSTLSSFQNLINRNLDSKVDLLLVDLLKEDYEIKDNRFNFY